MSKNRKYQYIFFFIFSIYIVFNGGNSNLLIQVNFILWSLLFLICLKDKNYKLHIRNFITNNKFSILIYLCFLLYLFLLIIPIPINFLKIFNPEKLNYLNNLSSNIVYSSTSITPIESFFQNLNYISILIFIFIVKMIFYTEKHKMRFYFFLSLLGFVSSVFAILFYLNGNPDFLLFKNSYYKNAATGFFINRTVFSIYLLFCLISSLEYLKNIDKFITRSKKNNFFLKLYVRLFILFITIGIVTSFSRIGNFLLFITMLFYLLNEILYVKRKNYTFKIILLFIVLFDILILGIYFGTSEIINRFYFLKEEFNSIPGEIGGISRFDLIKFSINEISNFIFFGYGAGGFENLFKLKFIDTSIQFANHSHSDLFEFVGEFGLIGFLLIIFSFIKFFLNKQNYSFVNILIITYLIIILSFDFSLHIPIIQTLFVMFFILNKKLVS